MHGEGMILGTYHWYMMMKNRLTIAPAMALG